MIKKIPTYLFLILMLLLTGYPFLWMFISSFKTNIEFFDNPWGLPKTWVVENYTNAWENGIQNYLLNSLIVTFVTVVGTLLTAAMISFILARRPFKGSGLLLSLFVTGIIIPFHSTLIPLFLIMQKLHLLNTRFSLYLPYIAFSLPVAVFLLYGFFKQLPKELEEAALIDGSGIYRMFFQIFLPLSRAILATVAILAAINAWNEFMLALVFLSDNTIQTLPIGLMSFQGAFTTDYAGVSAALVMSALPVILLYVLFQENVTKGLTAGAVKG